MKLYVLIFIVGEVILIAIAELTRINLLQQLQSGAFVSEDDLRVADFLQSLAFAPIGLSVGIAFTFFPRTVMQWWYKLTHREEITFPVLRTIIHGTIGLVFLIATLAALWSTGQFLFIK